ncbi:MAG: nitroreductase family protein [Elusimicrobiota bacterium]|jgi:nitroreductase|nr:nitroreductase family protein [Elusimicrobiota bacterium]
METLEAIRSRFSCRNFKSAAISQAQFEAIAQAAIQSPSGMNRQKWQIVIVKTPEIVREIEAEGWRVISALPDKTVYDRIMSRGGKLFYNAPAIIFIAIEKPNAETALSYGIDCGIVAQNIALAAEGLGLGSVICGLAEFAFSKEKGEYFKEKLHFPPNYVFGMSVLIGQPAVEGKGHEPNQDKISYI